MKVEIFVKKVIYRICESIYPKLSLLRDNGIHWSLLRNHSHNLYLKKTAKIYSPYKIDNSDIGDYTYISSNAKISMTTIGRFCSIGPNLMCGWGIHPTNGISTAPMFYSTLKQNGMSFSLEDKVVERKNIVIGNDVFIGANVTILDGVKIGDGAVIGAGAVVSKDIPSYAIAVGVPIKVIDYRFDAEIISKLLKIKWWDFDFARLKDVEKHFFNLEEFIEKNS